MQQIEDIYELSPTQIPLTISQRRFFQFDNPKPHHYNNALLREVVRPLHPDYLEQALRHVLAHHDGFRQVFRRNHAGWQGTITTYAKVPLSYVDISALPAGERSAFIEIAAAHWQQGFRLSQGPNLRVVLFHCGPDQPQRLLVVMHHLLTDAISTNIFLGDLKTAYMQVSGGEPVRLPQQTTALKTWTERIVEHTLSGALCPEIPYWLAERRRDVLRVPVDYPAGVEHNTQGSARRVVTTLPVEETRAFSRIVGHLGNDNIQVLDVLLAALVRTFAALTNKTRMVVLLANNGRNTSFSDIDLSRTAGFISFHYPMLLDITGCSTMLQTVYAINEQMRGVPNGGIGYGMLRYVSTYTDVIEELQSQPAPDVFFNYLGRQVRDPHNLLQPARESSRSTHDPIQSRLRYLYCKAAIVDNQLLLDWEYSEHIHKEATIGRMLQCFVDEIRNAMESLHA